MAAVCAAATLACAAGRSAAEDWPQWRGASHNDVTSEASGFPGGWPPRKLWDKDVGKGCTSPILAGGKLYVMGWQGTGGRRGEGPGTDTVYCLDARTGRELWSQPYPCPYQGRVRTGDEGAYGGPSSTPTYDAATGYLYTLSIDGDLRCWDANQGGRPVWSLNFHDRYKVRQRPGTGGGTRDFGYPSSPLILGDLLLAEVGAQAGTVIAFDKKAGRQRWASQYNRPAGHTGGLVPMKVGGADCIAVLTLHDVVVMRVDAGHAGRTVATARWETEFACNVATPAVGRVEPAAGPAGPAQLLVTSAYNHKTATLFDVTLTGMRTRWESRYYATVTSPVIHGGRAYTINHAVQCLDLATGRLLWRGGNFGDGNCLLTADGKMIAFGAGKLALVEAGPGTSEYRELSRVGRVVSGTCYPHVALSDGVLACKDRDGHLVCFSVRAGGAGEPVARTEPPEPTAPEPKESQPPAPREPPAPTEPATAIDAPTPKIAADWPGNREELVFVWALAKRDNAVTDAQGKVVRACKLEARGDARLTAQGAMVLGQGAFLASRRAGTDDALLAACRRTNRLSIEATITPDNVTQDGPARIVSFSTDPYHRNFTLGQERSKLILRLRTPRTGLNGMEPETPLCDLAEGKPHHVIVTYEPGRLTCYLNGKRVLQTDRVQGDFGNWTAQHLLFGDEWKDARLWSGRLQGLAIHSRVIGPEEAGKRYRMAGGQERDGS